MCYLKGSLSFLLRVILNRLYSCLSIETIVSQIVRLVRVTASPLVCDNCILGLCNAVEIDAASIETILNGNFVNSILELNFVSSLVDSSFSEREGERRADAEDSLAVYLVLPQNDRADQSSFPALPRASSAVVLDSLRFERHFSESRPDSQDFLLDCVRV